MKVPLTNRTIWLTGASSGIGFSLACALLEKNNVLVVTARGEEKLLELKAKAPDRVHIICADIGDEQSMQNLSESLKNTVCEIDTVILNAGNCEYPDIQSQSDEQGDRLTFDTKMIERVMNINFFGSVRCVRAALPLLAKSKKAPHIVGVTSAASYIGLPRSEAYGSSKAAMRHFLQAIRLDLLPYDIAVSIVYPGFVDTPLTQKNDFPMPFIMTVEKAVHRMVDGMEKRKMEIAFPRRLLWPIRFLSFLPAPLSAALCQSMVRTSDTKESSQ